jgi:hypothetical protein
VTSVSVTGGEPVGWGRLLDARMFPNGEQGLAMDLSPDGSRVVLVAYISGNHVGLFMEAAGGEPQLIADGPPGAQGADVRWSPDGGLLAVQWHVYPSPGGGGIGGQLEFMAPDGSGRRTVPGVGFAGISPNWAPDGSALVAARSTTRAGRVGGGTVVVTRSGHVLVPRALAHTVYPAWAPPAAREIPPVLPPDPTPEPGTAAAIPPPLNDPRCTPSVTAGSAVAVASCFLRGDGGTFRSSGRVRVNGIDVTPRGSTIVVDPRRKVIRSTGTVEVRLGPIYLARTTIDCSCSARRAAGVGRAVRRSSPASSRRSASPACWASASTVTSSSAARSTA